MSAVRPAPISRNFAITIVAIVFVALLVSAGLRSAPGALMPMLERSLGWSRDSISAVAAIGIFLYGLVGPFAGALMNSIGVRRTMLGALVLMSASTGASFFMTETWQYFVTWGVLSGVGSGCVAAVLGATIVNRWFQTNRGLIMGLLTASTATGTLLFLPGMAALGEHFGWQSVVIAITLATGLLVPFVYFLLPESPASAGVLPYGAQRDAPLEPPARREGMLEAAFATLLRAARTRTFWLLFATFFVCGLTTNGLVGTHLIAYCGDNSIPEVNAAWLLAAMGVFDLIGTTLSGMLTDRFDARKLLFMYYGLRGLSLIALPYTDFSLFSLSIFAIFYGLDWIATVPPTLKLTTEAFGDRAAPIVFGWILAGHQAGAATAAFVAGKLRVIEGDYASAFILAGLTALIAALLALLVRRASPVPEPVAVTGAAV